MVWTPAATGVPINLQQDIGTATCWIQTKALDLGQVDFVKELDQIFSHITNRATQTNLVLYIYSSDDEDGPYDLDDTINLSQEEPANVDPPGRVWFKLRYADLGIIERWTLHRIEVWGRIGGRS